MKLAMPRVDGAALRKGLWGNSWRNWGAPRPRAYGSAGRRSAAAAAPPPPRADALAAAR
jgi:hypothetical protein